jgi:DNA-binding LacI/PurR family transcriptional regulator
MSAQETSFAGQNRREITIASGLNRLRIGFPFSMAIQQARPTIRDIGRTTGFHYSTVSLALRDHPRIPDSTKQIIREAAQRLHYKPDAMLNALCAYRLMKREPKNQTVIAWVTNHRARTGWRMSACTRDYFDGASQRAKERGYQLETFWLAEPGMTGERMNRILWTRGIRGVLLPPQEQLTSIELEWGSLSAVTFGYTLRHPRLHLVSNHEYRTMGTLFAELEKRGYQRIGLVNLRLRISSNKPDFGRRTNFRRWSLNNGMPGRSSHGQIAFGRTSLSHDFRKSCSVCAALATSCPMTLVSPFTPWMRKAAASPG